MRKAVNEFLAIAMSTILVCTSVTLIPRNYNNGILADEVVENNSDAEVTEFNYEFAYTTPGYADGTITISATKDGVYRAFWGDESGNKLTKNGYEYSYFAKIVVKDGEGSYNIASDYTAIPEGASKVLVYKKQDIKYVYNIPEDRVFVPTGESYTFGALSDPHYGRYSNTAEDDAVPAMNNALAFFDNIGIDFVGITGDLTAGGEQQSLDKYNEALSKYPDMTVLICTGNHDSRTTISSSNTSTLDTSISRWYNSITSKYFTVDEDGTVTNNLDHEILSTNALTNPITTYYREKAGDEALETTVPGLDFVTEAEGNIFIFLNEIAQTGETYDTDKLITTAQMDWLQEQLHTYKDKNVFLFFHSFLGVNTSNNDVIDYDNCTGDLKNAGGYSYNLDFKDEITTSDGMNMQALLNEYSNVHMLSGHSHWQYGMQEINPDLNIGRLDNGDGATLIHISSVTTPRYIGDEDPERMDLSGYASEGSTVTVYDDCIVYNCIDFYNGQYEAYGTYIVPVGENSQYNPVKDNDYKESTNAITGDEYLEVEDMTFIQLLKSDYNLAYAKEYTQSTVGGENTEGALVDGSLSGFMNTERNESAKEQEIVIDLGKNNIQKVSNIDYYMLYSQNNLTYVTDFNVLISLDGTNYETAGSYTGVALETTSFEPDLSQVTLEEFRYIKLQLMDGKTAYGYQIKEFAVIGLEPIKYEKVADQSSNVSSPSKNIALNKAVMVSSIYENESSDPTVLTDGKLDKYWSSDWDNALESDYIIIDLGKEYDAADIVSVLVNYKSDNTFCGDYGIEFSNTYNENNPEEGFYEVARTKASSWQILKRISDDKGYTVTPIADVESNNIRYVKVNMDGHKPYGFQVYEVAVITDGIEEETTTEEITTQEITTEEITTITKETITIKDETTSVYDEKPSTEKTTTGKVTSDEKVTSSTVEKTSTTAVENAASNNTSAGNKNVKVPKAKIKKIASKALLSNKINITLKKLSGIKGYQIKISTTKKFKKSKKNTITKIIKKNLKKKSFTVKSNVLKGKKKLYVKIRAYKIINGKKKYGAWSTVKKIKIK